VREEVPALSALNMRLRDDFINDTSGGVRRWNTVIEKAGYEYRLALPHVAFHRGIGEFAAVRVDPEGKGLTETQWKVQKEVFLPTAEDGAYLDGLMIPERTPGRYANWIAPPKVGIDNKPGDFEYVRLE
jgi:benzoyl-CoA 2,3-epoxidase subunit B